jgi:hypothetical protein
MPLCVRACVSDWIHVMATTSIFAADILGARRATLPPHLLPCAREERRLLRALAVQPRPVTGALNDAPCILWRGAAQFRYARKRWRPRRLLYALGVPGGAARIEDAANNDVVHVQCAHGACVQPRHLQLAPYTNNLPAARAPPYKKRKQAPAASDHVVAATAQADPMAIVALARRRVRAMHATLAQMAAAAAETEGDGDAAQQVLFSFEKPSSSSSSSSSSNNNSNKLEGSRLIHFASS